MKIVSNYDFEPTSPKNLRIIPKGLQSNLTPTQKTGFKVYNKVIGWFLSLLCIAVRLEDAQKNIYYVNKRSLKGWATANGAESNFQLKNLDQLLQNMRPVQNQPAEEVNLADDTVFTASEERRLHILSQTDPDDRNLQNVFEAFSLLDSVKIYKKPLFSYYEDRNFNELDNIVFDLIGNLDSRIKYGIADVYLNRDRYSEALWRLARFVEGKR